MISPCTKPLISYNCYRVDELPQAVACGCSLEGKSDINVFVPEDLRSNCDYRKSSAVRQITPSTDAYLGQASP